MTLYAHVTGGEVDGVGLPEVWRRDDGTTVSGYQFSDPAGLAADGWLPVTEVRPDLGDGETYGAAEYVVGAEEITATYAVVPLPEALGGGPSPFSAFSTTLRAQLPAATTNAKMRTALTDALDELDAALETP